MTYHILKKISIFFDAKGSYQCSSCSNSTNIAWTTFAKWQVFTTARIKCFKCEPKIEGIGGGSDGGALSWLNWTFNIYFKIFLCGKASLFVAKSVQSCCLSYCNIPFFPNNEWMLKADVIIETHESKNVSCKGEMVMILITI